MNRLLQILAITLFLGSCTSDNGLEGLWYGAYTITDNETEYLRQTTLLEFKGDQLYTITIRDFSTGELDKVNIDTATFEINDSTLKIKSYSFTIHYSEDSIVLGFDKPNQKSIYRRVPLSLRNTSVMSDCFNGSFYIKSKHYQDSIDFINDSILIYTGEYDQNFPGKKWQIVDYNGFKFFNPHAEHQPVTIIKSCNTEGIELVYLSIQSIDIKMIPTKSRIEKKQFIGSWKESENSYPQPPVPHNLSDKDLLYTMEISNDSIKIEKYGWTKIYKWDLTSDGKRIYFLDIVLENEGSWKVLQLSDSTMTIRMSSQSGFKEEIVKFKKEKNGR